MRTKLRALALALAATTLTAGAANAAIELQSYSFTATTDGPITNHSGSFVLAYDDVADIYSLNSIDFRLGSYVFDLTNAALESDGNEIVVGGKSDIFSLIGETYDFLAIIYSSGGVSNLRYTVQDSAALYKSAEMSVTRRTLQTPTPGAVPEPTTWALMILGFGAAGAALRRRRLAIA